MAVLQTILTIVFVIASVFLVFMILIQSNRSAGMGLFGGGASQTAFGSSSGDVLTRITAILAAIFLLLALLMAFMKTDPADRERIKKVIQELHRKKTSKSENATAPAKKEDDNTAGKAKAANQTDEGNSGNKNSSDPEK